MIVRRDELQALQCNVCGQMVELMRVTVSDPQALVERMEDMAELHRGCEMPGVTPERARAEKVWQQGMRRELGLRGRCLNRRSR